MAWQTIDQQYGQQTDRNDRSNYLKDIIAGLSIASNNDPSTLLGYGIGRFLSNYVNRGLERRQQDKNQEAYDKWIQGKNGIKGEEIMPLLKGTPIVNEDASPRQDYSFANQIADQMSGRPDAVKDALAANGINTDGNFFPAPQRQQQPQPPQAQQEAPQDINQAVQSIASEIASRPSVDRRYNMTSDEIYQNAYNIARKNGSTEDQARKFAQQQAGLYQSQRVQSLSDQFLNGGVNPDGTINNQGVAMLARLAQENPNQTNLLGNMYMNPQAQAKNAQDIAKLMMNSDLHLRNTLQAQQQAAALREQAAQAAFGRQWDLLNARQQMEIDNKMRMAEILSSAAGLSPQEALLSVFGAGGGRGGSGGASRRSDDAKADKEHFSRLDKWLERYEKTNRDPISGEWLDGTGPGDPEYDDRLDQYNRYTAKQYDSDDYEDAIRITQSLIDRGYPAEGVAQYVDEKFGELAPQIKRDLNLK